jgi:hypothetical protein
MEELELMIDELEYNNSIINSLTTKPKQHAELDDTASTVNDTTLSTSWEEDRDNIKWNNNDTTDNGNGSGRGSSRSRCSLDSVQKFIQSPDDDRSNSLAGTAERSLEEKVAAVVAASSNNRDVNDRRISSSARQSNGKQYPGTPRLVPMAPPKATPAPPSVFQDDEDPFFVGHSKSRIDLLFDDPRPPATTTTTTTATTSLSKQQPERKSTTLSSSKSCLHKLKKPPAPQSRNVRFKKQQQDFATVSGAGGAFEPNIRLDSDGKGRTGSRAVSPSDGSRDVLFSLEGPGGPSLPPIKSKIEERLEHAAILKKYSSSKRNVHSKNVHDGGGYSHHMLFDDDDSSMVDGMAGGGERRICSTARNQFGGCIRCLID